MTIPSKTEDSQCTCLPAICTEHTDRFNLHHNRGNPSPSQSGGRRLDKRQPKRRHAKLTADGFEWVNRLQVNQWILMAQADLVELRMISHHPPSQEHLPCTPVDLAPVVMQQVAVVKIPTSQDRRSPIWPCTSLMMLSSLMTHIRLYLLRMPLVFLTFQDRILNGSTVVTFYQQRSLGFEAPTITS